MTGACRQVMAECDFAPGDVRDLELLLLRHSPKQLISFFWRKDPRGEHGLEWFKPFFVHRYVKETVDVQMPGATDDDFWTAYDWWDRLGDLSTFDIPHILTMSRDLGRMREAYGKANVKAPAYVAKVFEGIEVRVPPKATKVDFVIGNSGNVRTSEL